MTTDDAQYAGLDSSGAPDRPSVAFDVSGAPDGPGAGRALRRDVVSFARRDGRFAARHAAAWDTSHARWHVVPPRAARSTSIDPDWRFDAASVFGRRAPLVVEIGTGTGDAILASAASHPQWDHLGVEVYRPGLARTVIRARRAGATNVRMIDADGAALVRTALAAGSVTELRIFFPDPWHKARHHKRRLVDTEFLTAAAAVLAPGGVVRLATDWEDYAQAMLVAARHCEGLVNPHVDSGGFAQRYAGRPATRFETKGRALGRTIRDLELRRR